MLSQIKGLLKFKNFQLFTRPYELNIVGLRGKSTVPNLFDDELHVFFKVNALNWQYYVFKITTDPGTFWLKNPMQPQGTALVAEGQFINAYSLGLHHGLYEALVQRKPITIMREYDRTATLDFYNGKKERGMYGINIHRANKVGTTKTIDKNSAGCQVFANADDFATFIKLCHQHRSHYGNFFTYTLIDFRTVQRRVLRMTVYTIGLLLTATLTGYFYLKTKQEQIAA